MQKISLYNSQRDLPLSLPRLRKAVAYLLKALKISQGVIFHFVSKAKICQLHKKYFKDPSSTDCITFPIHSPDVLGEAFICPKVARDYAQSNKLDPDQELLRYVIHCLLHLLGYDDLKPADRVKMKRKENAYLKKLVEFLQESPQLPKKL